MYYPYLRGKQFELIALREFAQEHEDCKKIIPIVEPVRLSCDGLVKTVGVYSQKQLPIAVVLNPTLGDFEHGSQRCNIKEALGDLSYIPAFIWSKHTDDISEFIQKNSLNNIMLIFLHGVDSDDDKVVDLLSNSKISHIVGLENRSLKRKAHNAGKQVIVLKDCFNKRASNKNYKDAEDELYSADHAFYAEDGFDGFSDYCVLPKDFTEGGVQPKYVAIHLTYKKNEEEVWVHHFVSDMDVSGNIQGKFAEAARKVDSFYDGRSRTETVKALLEYYTEGKYPGLGMLKKYSITNHLELMSTLL